MKMGITAQEHAAAAEILVGGGVREHDTYFPLLLAVFSGNTKQGSPHPLLGRAGTTVLAQQSLGFKATAA